MRRDHDDARVGKHSSTLHRAPLTFTGAAAILESERRAREAGDAAAAAPFLLSGWMDGWMDKEEEKKKRKAWVFSGSSDLVSVTTLPLPSVRTQPSWR